MTSEQITMNGDVGDWYERIQKSKIDPDLIAKAFKYKEDHA